MQFYITIHLTKTILFSLSVPYEVTRWHNNHQVAQSPQWDQIPKSWLKPQMIFDYNEHYGTQGF